MLQLPGGGDNRNCMGNDLSLIAYRLRLLGFNAIRLPFRFFEFDLPASSFIEVGCTMPTLEEFKALSVPDALQATAATLELPFEYDGWKCQKPSDHTWMTSANFYVPGPRGDPGIYDIGRDSGRPFVEVFSRFLWTVQYFVAQGFYVALDYHPYGSQSDWQLSSEGSAYSTPAKLAKKWGDLVTALMELPVWEEQLKGRIMVDLANEMDILNCEWDKTGTPREYSLVACPPYKDLANAVIDTVTALSPETIIWVGGIGQKADKCNNWGEGFRTENTTVDSSG
jgi:hypothetical protein